MSNVIYALGVLAALTVGSLLLFKAATRLSKWRNRLDVRDVISFIEKHIDGTEGPWDWDEFTTRPIANDELDQVRLLCARAGEYPLSDDQRRSLAEIVSRLREADPKR